MIKSVLFFMGVLLAMSMQAQVILNLQLPPMGLTVKPQLWNMSLVNTSTGNYNVRVEVVLTDVSTGQRVLTGTSNVFLLPKGVKQVRAADVVPVTYSIGNPGYTVDATQNGFLPVGVFTVCYSVITADVEVPEKLSGECETVEVEPVSPPQLVVPADNEELAVSRPVFTWLPPSPFNSVNSLLYDWLLVEVQPTQSAADAIQQNIPLLARGNVSFTSFQYPLSMAELDTGKIYAWRITAKNNSSPIANSEIWTFRIKKDNANATATMPTGYFARLHPKEDAAYVLCNGIVRFEYTNEINSHEAAIKIFDISSSGRKQIVMDSSSYAIRSGQNFIQLDLRDTPGMISKHMYLLELYNAKQERWYLKFEYRK